jgi:hypothetical protein
MSDDAKYSGIHSKFTREEIAEMEIGKTAISRPLRIAVVAGFLLTIASIPVIQHIIEIRQGFETEGHWVWPQAYDIKTFPGHAWRAFSDPEVHGLWTKIQAANSSVLHDVKIYEKALEDNSFLAHATLPHTQALTAEFLGLGNEEVYLGRDGWVFYQPEVGYLSGPGFLDPAFQRARARKGHVGEEQQPDPVKAIVQFRDQLEQRGIHLIIMPAPVKPMIEPEELSSRYHAPLPIPLQNPSYTAFLQKLKDANVDVLDVSETLAQAKLQTGEHQFLRTDTHWTPEAMEAAAGLLAEKIQALGLVTGSSVDLQTSTETISNTGDIVNMLKLPASSKLYPLETATIHPVQKADGTPWTPDPSASILFLGDSFSNIYSLGPMGWGASAGLVEHLSYNLHQPVDAILRNDAGAHATREILAKDLALGHDRLAGKKILVWEFAMRELSVGDWKIVELKQPAAAASAPPAAAQFYAPADGAAPIRVTAIVREVSTVPRPGTVPYKDQVFAVHLAELSGPGIPGGSEAVVYLFGMKDNVLTPASQWKPDDHVTLDLRSWNDVSDKYDRLNRSELDNTDLQLQPPCWGEPAP